MPYDTYPMVHLPRAGSGYPKSDTCLGCPNCKGYNMHHMRARVSFRTEDSNEGTYVDIAEGVVDTRHTQLYNPSARRSGLLIDFWCEDCDERSLLALAQHKGLSLMYWVDPKDYERELDKE